MSAPVPAPSSRPLAPVPPPEPDDKQSLGGQIGGVVQAIVGAVRRAGDMSSAGLGEAVDAPLRALTRRIVTEAHARPRPVTDTAALTAELAERPHAPLLGGASAAALAAKVARRFGPLRFLARRTPMWLVAAAVPALYASVARGADELGLIASHLVHRTRASGGDPDPERVRRAAVQIMAGAPVNPDTEPRHGPLVVAWIRRALRATLPFTKGVATEDPYGLAAAATAVPPSSLTR